jgi:uroporphyrinogen-III decarboxylase
VDLDQALRIVRPDMVLRGNIDQVEFMMKATPGEVRDRVKEVLLKVKPRGNWILSTTDFFFDGTPYENIQTLVDTGQEFGVF